MECLSIGHLFRPRYGGIMSDRICDVSRIQSTIPARAGVGLKPEHGPDIRADSRKVAFFEVHAENYMGAGGPPHQFLEEIRREYPLSLHGVGLSIGGEGALSLEHLQRLRALNERYEPGLFSEHLAWSTHDTAYYNDLLPVPYNAETCRRVCDHIDQVQEVVGRQMLLENPSTYVAFEATTMQEVDFLSEIVQRTGCGLLLDVNNIHVSCVNHLQSASDYISAFPLEFVQEIHLGGHAPDLDDDGRTLLIDAHDREVDQVVWQLYGELIEKTGPIPTLIEWDNDVPEWSVLLDEAQAADRILNKFAGNLLQKVG